MRTSSRRRAMLASGLALALMAGLAAAMLPMRAHLSVATAALILVVPVVAGAVAGGFAVGLLASLCGFLTYDVLFIKPYNTLTVGAGQNWAALGVYVVVSVAIARVVARADAARADAQRRAAELQRLVGLSELLVRDSSLPELLETIVSSVLRAFELDGAALLLPVGGQLSVVATAGETLDERDLERLGTRTPGPVSLDGTTDNPRQLRVVALATSGQPVGLLALRGLVVDRNQLRLLRTFANHLALALERGQLREQAIRAQLLEEIDRLRQSLVGAVSHDLRTPLATIKVSTSTLLDPAARVSSEDTRELLELIDYQTDRLERLVANLLDMTRIQSGTLELRPVAADVPELIDDAIAALGSSTASSRLCCELAGDLSQVVVDRVLIVQVLANLIDNALRYSPEREPVTIAASSLASGRIEVSVSDRGPGVALDEQVSIFEMTNRRESGGRGGLGLAIAKAFVEAHGEHIWVERGDDELGARFVFTMPALARLPVG